MFEAARFGNTTRLTELLGKGVPVDTRDEVTMLIIQFLRHTLGPVLLAGTNFSVLIDCCIWRVLTLAFSYSCSIHNYYR